VAKSGEVPKQLLDKSGDAYRLSDKFRLDRPFPGVPASTGIEQQAPPATRSTVLKNGLTVATQDLHGLMSSFSFIVGTGSSYENQEQNDTTGTSTAVTNTGATQMLELCAFRGTMKRTHQELSTEMEQLGGMVQCLSTRENIMYCVDVLRENVDKALDVLADTVLTPLLSEEDLEHGRMVIDLQQNELPSDILSKDAIQIAAYKGTPLGNAHFCPTDQAGKLNEAVLRKFRQDFFVGSNCYVTAAGVEHESFVRLVEEKFATLPSGTKGKSSRAPSVYVGGMVKNERELKEPFVKIALGYEVGGWNDDMLVATCVLQQLLGGGSSFSAGGPGKGMYTRLYREVLNTHWWAESAECFLAINEESGVMGIDGACAPDKVQELILVIIDQLCKLTIRPVSDEELSRAKNMLKSMMLMQLESRLVLCEDLARQFVTYGKRDPPSVVCNKIDLITKEDLMNVAKRMFKSPPSLGCVGIDLKNLPPYDMIKQHSEVTAIKYQAAAESAAAAVRESSSQGKR